MDQSASQGMASAQVSSHKHRHSRADKPTKRQARKGEQRSIELIVNGLRACRWLVGISYRVMFRRDPFPAQSTVPNTLKHVHGAIYLCGDGMRPGDQPDHIKTDKGDIRDHTPSAYLGALNTNCERQAAREKAAGTDYAEHCSFLPVLTNQLAQSKCQSKCLS